MSRKLKRFLPALIFFGLLAANIGVLTASAHNWGSWHWDKTGSQIVIQEYQYGGHTAQSEAARLDAWNKVSNLYNYSVSSHTDISVYDGNYGNTGWVGLASIESSSGSHITHAHSKYNTYYNYSSSQIQGVFCQEDFHTYGFDHDNTGGCMGLGYYSGSAITLNSHNSSDFYNRYINH